MPMNKALYPKNWMEISARIRERAGNRCEDCGLENYAIILRSVVDAERYLILDESGYHCEPDTMSPYRMSEIPEEYDLNEKYTKVVLTVAHLDHNPQNNADENLRCWCQLHHLRHDAKHHAAKAARTRRQKRDRATGQMSLFEAGVEGNHG